MFRPVPEARRSYGQADENAFENAVRQHGNFRLCTIGYKAVLFYTGNRKKESGKYEKENIGGGNVGADGIYRSIVDGLRFGYRRVFG